uniref:Uncharacterized protein n=1 Tax=Physcomitrium patens TaxID=3218 RepID=A0A2K1K5J3_PHYPA|nr:hypothetical protein PHYPA_010957 [Physcomitrium patens]
MGGRLHFHPYKVMVSVPGDVQRLAPLGSRASAAFQIPTHSLIQHRKGKERVEREREREKKKEVAAQGRPGILASLSDV